MCAILIRMVHGVRAVCLSALLCASEGFLSANFRARPGSALREQSHFDFGSRDIPAPAEYDDFVTSDGRKMKYEFLKPLLDQKEPCDHPPTVFYLPSLNRTTGGLRATCLHDYASKTGQGYMSLSYWGVGEEELLPEATISRWVNDTIEFIKWKNPAYNVVLVGAGVGGWVALRIAKLAPKLVNSVVTVNCEPDFTMNLLPKDWFKDIEEKEEVEFQWGRRVYKLHQNFVKDAKENHRVFEPGLRYFIPHALFILHAVDDEEVPVERALWIVQRLYNERMELIFTQRGGHYMDDVAALDTLQQTVAIASACEVKDPNLWSDKMRHERLMTYAW